MSVPSFERPQTYILVWPGDDYARPCYGGEVVVVPPADEIAVEGQGLYRFGAAKDAAGKPIPGTVALKDIGAVDDDGNKVLVFDAQNWCKGIYDVNRPLVARGFSVVMDASEVERARAEGKPKWRRAKREEYESIVRNELQRRKSFESKGQPPTELSPEENDRLRKAQVGLKVMHEEDAATRVSDNDLLAALGAGPAKPGFVPPVVDEDADLDQIADQLFAQAKKLGVKLSHSEKDALLERNPEAMSAINDKLSKLDKPEMVSA